jgi:hypothetical protein
LVYRIGWEYNPDAPHYDIDDYEARHTPLRRSEMGLALSRETRTQMLQEWGESSIDISHAIHQVVRVKTQRRLSIHQKTDSVLERTGSALLRKLHLKKCTTKEALELQRQHMASMEQQAKYQREQEAAAAMATVPSAEASSSSLQSHSICPTDEEFDYASYFVTPASPETTTPIATNNNRTTTRYIYSVSRPQPVVTKPPIAQSPRPIPKTAVTKSVVGPKVVSDNQRELKFVPDGLASF